MANYKPTSPLIWCLCVQAAILALALVVALGNQQRLVFFDSSARNTKYDELYNLTLSHTHLENDNVTPTAVMGNGALARLQFDTAAIVFDIFSAAAIAAAMLLGARSFFSERRAIIGVTLMGVAAAALGYPLWKLLNEGPLDAIAAFLALAAMFLLQKGSGAAAIPPSAPPAELKRAILIDYCAGAALGLAVMVQPRMGFLLLPVLLLRNYRMFSGFLCAAAMIFAITPGMWVEYVKLQLHSPPVFIAQENGSFASIIYTLRNFGTYGDSDDPLRLASGGVLLFLPFLLINVLADVKRGVPAEREKQAALFASYLPFALAVPCNIDVSAFVLAALLLPLLAYRWSQSASRQERIGVGIASVGCGLPQSHFFLLAVMGWPKMQAIPAFSGLLIILGITLSKLDGFVLSVRSNWRRFVFAADGERICYLALGIGLGVFMWHDYARGGFSSAGLVAWFLSIALCCLGLASTSVERSEIRFGRIDAMVCAGLALLFFIPYCLATRNIPVQVNTDEANVVSSIRSIMSWPVHDWFGLNYTYFDFPSGGFYLLGHLASWMGDINLENVRRASALLGVLMIISAYVFFRQLANWRHAATVAVLFGCCHALLGISRMALRDNVPVCLEAMAFALFYCGWSKRRYSLLCLGGVLAGLGMYTYYSGRIVILVWLCFLAFLLLFRRSSACLKQAFLAGAAAVLGFVLSAAPMFVTVQNHSQRWLDYAQAQSVLFTEGRAVTRDWEGTSDTRLALARNLGRGLTIFNNNNDDHGNIYNNRGFGFVDPLSGVLLWIGVLRIVTRKRRRTSDLLVFAGLLAIWLPVSIFMNKNPCYSRYLPVMPFAMFLVFIGAQVVSWRLSALLTGYVTRRLRGAVLGIVILGACAWNGFIYYHYVHEGFEEGEITGNTVRLAQDRTDNAEWTIYVCTDDRHPYYWFGGNAWRDWIECSMKPDQHAQLLRPSAILDPNLSPMIALVRPCTIFMSGDIWKKCADRLRKESGDLHVNTLSKDNAQVAVDLP